MSGNNMNVIGEVSVEVKAGLTVDKKTFKTCMNLAAIHADNQGLKGMVVFFNREDPDGYLMMPLETDERCAKVWDAAVGRGEE